MSERSIDDLVQDAEQEVAAMVRKRLGSAAARQQVAISLSA